METCRHRYRVRRARSLCLGGWCDQLRSRNHRKRRPLKRSLQPPQTQSTSPFFHHSRGAARVVRAHHPGPAFAEDQEEGAHDSAVSRSRRMPVQAVVHPGFDPAGTYTGGKGGGIGKRTHAGGIVCTSLLLTHGVGFFPQLAETASSMRIRSLCTLRIHLKQIFESHHANQIKDSSKTAS